MTLESLEFNKLEKKWQARWAKNNIFESDPDSREKFFLNIPYPYMNGFLHMGRLFTYLRGEVLARYKRMNNYNVLFPFAFHCTGSPIVNAAKRIADGEEKQIDILKKMGIEDDQIPKFSNPKYWTEFFPLKTKEHLQAMGLSIDWRRSFITTSQNPHYDNFIQWQFRTLKKKGYIVKGAHPVIWCSKCQNPVSDHSRLEGEGETPQEFTLLKFKYGDEYIIAATLRPETVFGQTNLWVDPEEEYVRAKVDGEIWIISIPAAQKLADQEKEVEILGTVKGSEIIGKNAIAPVIEKSIPILPSAFCNPCKGTGIVTSVPSDAPDDWMGLVDLKNDPEMLAKYNIDQKEIEKIEPVSILISKGWGPFPAKEICEKMNIKNQHDREKLTIAKKEIYKSGFYTGVMNESCGKYAGMSVEEAKEKVKRMMLKTGDASIMHEPSGDVVCRCLVNCTVKIVRDQYFLAYGDPEWKKLTHKAFSNIKFYPELIHKQFDYVVDWLNNWACTRKLGLGTKLPWDEKWMIESLSDSTIYMAYYTIAHKISEIDPEKLYDGFFDYVFLDNGPTSLEVAEKIGKDVQFVESLKTEFNYWYPFDLRTSGKDLIQNHLTFCIFNHTAIFPEKHWPRGIGVNGWLLVDNEKMSTSKGNVYLSKELGEKYGADIVRIGLMYSGEGIDDPNWETSFVEGVGDKLTAWYNFATQHYNKGREDVQYIDKWFESIVLNLMAEVKVSIEEMMYRTAIQKGYFDMQRALKWYLRRTEVPNKELINKFIEVQTKLLVPFCPHVAEEIWEAIGNHEFISTAAWPTPWAEPDENMIAAEDYIKGVIDDIKEIIKVAKIENPNTVYIYTAPSWKWDVVKIATELQDMKQAMGQVMQDEKMRKHGKKVSKFLTTIIKNRMFMDYIDEKSILTQAKSFVSKEIGAEVKIDTDYDPENKKDIAMPRRVAIYIE